MARRTSLTSLKQISEINMTPLMDLTFILLITFIITFPLIEQGIAINLPKGKASEMKELVTGVSQGGGAPGVGGAAAGGFLLSARGTLVVAGGHDQPCGALGAGVTKPGKAMYGMGTVESREHHGCPGDGHRQSEGSGVGPIGHQGHCGHQRCGHHQDHGKHDRCLQRHRTPARPQNRNPEKMRPEGGLQDTIKR